MLDCLVDGHARTSTELAVVADVTPPTASAHLTRLQAQGLVSVAVQGKHRYYRLAGPDVASALEALSVVAGGRRDCFEPPTPRDLRGARTCYDHIAGSLGVALHDQLMRLRWLSPSSARSESYDVTTAGIKAFEALGIDIDATRGLRRHFAYACLDWSERRPHLAGSLGAAILTLALKRKWVVQDLDSRILRITRTGRTEMQNRFHLA
jgi:hypothetical protein